MKYLNIRLIPRFNVLQYNITYYPSPFEELDLSVESIEKKRATEQILKNAMELIRAAYDIKVEVREWSYGEEEN